VIRAQSLDFITHSIMPNGTPISIKECKGFRRGRMQYPEGGNNSWLINGGDTREDGSNEVSCYNG
jgi:hypothetical protein